MKRSHVLSASASWMVTLAQPICAHAQSVQAWGELGLVNVDAADTPALAAHDTVSGLSAMWVIRADGSLMGWGDSAVKSLWVPAGLPPLSTIASSGLHTLALSANGKVFAWGYNMYGQTNVPQPNEVCIAVATGDSHSLAIRADGTVKGWGGNNFGQASPPGSLGLCTSITAGFGFSAAVKSTGQVVAWGNLSGGINVPANLGLCTRVRSLATHIVALKTDGTVRCWGSNTFGKCDVPADLGACTDVAAGLNHTVALLANGTVVCWGDNSEGACNVPPGLSDVVAVAASTRSWAVRSNGSIVTWGTGFPSLLPAPIGPVVAAAAGAYNGDQMVFIRPNGSLANWPKSPTGEQFDVPLPRGPHVQVAVGVLHALGLRPDRTVVAWGSNVQGSTTVPALPSIAQLAAGFNFSIAVDTNGAPHCWGVNNFGQCEPPPQAVTLRRVAARIDHTVALRNDGTVVCWGRNQFQQCVVPAIGQCIAVAAGEFHSVALKANGQVACWGRNNKLQCSVPTDLLPCVAVGAGREFSTALQANGVVRVWGQADGLTGGTPVLPTVAGLVTGSHSVLALIDVGQLSGDCDGDAIDDGLATSTGFVADLDGGGVPDSCQIAFGDFDLNGVVDGADLAILLGLWGSAGATGAGDFNGDGIVNTADLMHLFDQWGQEV